MKVTPFEEMCEAVLRSTPGVFLVTIAFKNPNDVTLINIPRVHILNEIEGETNRKAIPSLRHSLNKFAIHVLNENLENLGIMSGDFWGEDDDDNDEDYENEEEDNSRSFTSGKIVIDIYAEEASIVSIQYNKGRRKALPNKKIDTKKWKGPQN